MKNDACVKFLLMNKSDFLNISMIFPIIIKIKKISEF